MSNYSGEGESKEAVREGDGEGRREKGEGGRERVEEGA